MIKEQILIPKERIAVLIGKKGVGRKQMETKGNVKIWIDSDSNEVSIHGKSAEDVYFARQAVELIGRGFSPESACKVLTGEFCAELCDVRDFGAKEKKDRQRVLGRLIGTKGKAKNSIERETNTEIIVYGKTVGIIGKPEDVGHARRAVESLLSGSRHGTAYKFFSNRSKSC